MLFSELSLVFLFSFFLAMLASFFNVVIFRTFKEESFIKGRSKCESCHKQIAWYDNIPLLSFLLLRGKCRNCHKKISKIYFLTEVFAFFVGILFYLAYVNVPFLQGLPVGNLVTYLLIFFVLIFAGLADLRYLIVPDFFVLLLIILVLILQIISGQNWQLPIFSVFFSTIFFYGLRLAAHKFLKKEALGLGDLKLMIPLSFLLSWPNTALSIFLAFIIGGIFAMLTLIMGKKKIGQALAFAPFLILAVLISFAFGQKILSWYLGLLF